MLFKEHVVVFMLGNKIRLSNYDHKFLSNLQIMYHRDRRVTTNQARLMDLLINKYARQISNNQYKVNELLDLPWNVEVIESREEYTDPKVSLKDDNLLVQIPFNKKFIDYHKANLYGNPFVFDKESRRYVAPFTTRALKQFHRLLKDHFQRVIYLDGLDTLIKDLESFSPNLIWNPTLVKREGRLYIAGANPTIMKMLENVELREDCATYHRLSQLAVKVDENLLNTPMERFSAKFIAELDLELAISRLPEFLKEIGCTSIIFSAGASSAIKDALTPVLIENNISSFSIVKAKNVDTSKAVLIQPESLTKTWTTRFAKCLIIKNSRPVRVK